MPQNVLNKYEIFRAGQSSSANLKSRMSPTSSVDVNSPSPSAPDRQFVIICSEKQARVTTAILQLLLT